MGGGGVPDDDSISLGLGKQVGTYTQLLSERSQKYSETGFLLANVRANLLTQWQTPESLLSMLRKRVDPELRTLRCLRSQSVDSPTEQRYMPTDQVEAIQMADLDAAAAREPQGCAALQVHGKVDSGAYAPPSIYQLRRPTAGLIGRMKVHASVKSAGY